MYVLLSKLKPFTDQEVEIARSLNTAHSWRLILLTARELEPYYIFDRAKKEFDIDGYGGSPEDLARATAKMYSSVVPADSSE